MPTPAETYVDLYLLPVVAAELDLYERQARAFGGVAREHGALSYRELLGDDLRANLETAEGRVLVAAVVEFTSREHRDEVMERVLADPRLKELMAGEPPADMEQMRYGGFAPFVTL